MKSFRIYREVPPEERKKYLVRSGAQALGLFAIAGGIVMILAVILIVAAAAL